MGFKNKNIEDFYPLSPMQQGILFHSLAAPKSGIYFEQFSWNIHGKLNVTAFHRAWQSIIERYSILRTCFVWEGLKEPVQIVHRQVNLPWQEYNWQHLSPEEQQEKLELFFQSDRSSGFELKQPALMRLTLVQLSDISYNFTLSHHHLLLDGWSVALVFKEVLACYKAFSNSQDLYLESIRPYRDYIVWLQQQNLSEAETFWRQMLKGFTTPTQLLVNQRARKLPTQTDGYEEREVKLSVITTTALQSVAKQHQLTLNTLVQGAWALLLSCYSGQEDVVFGAVTSGRPPTLVKAESMVGLFINTVPIRVQVSPEEFLLPWLEKIKDQLVEARQYEYCPLVKVQGWSEVPKGLSLFESIIVFENYPVDPSLRQRDINLEIEEFHAFEKTNYPITLTVNTGEELLLKITYDDSDRFDTITRMLGHLQTLLEGMVSNPQQRLSELSLLTETERHQLLVEWNNTEVEYPQQLCIHQLFEAQVERTPDAVAVVFEDEQLTYCELNTRANQLAHYLQALGVKPEVLVGICVERSLDMVIGLLAILKAGGAYVPLDPMYPPERLAFMLENADIFVLLTHKRLAERLSKYKGDVICFDADSQAIAKHCPENQVSGVTPDNLMYAIYTSGSTGKPKGAGVYQRSFANLMNWFVTEFDFTCNDRVLLISSLSFDLTQKNIYAPLLVGGELHLLSSGCYDAAQIAESVCNKQVTWLNCTPSAFYPLIDQGDKSLCMKKTLKYVFLGGEPISISRLKVWLDSIPCTTQIVNTYGPTECTDICAAYRVAQPEQWLEKLVPIGKPIHNAKVYILDENLKPLPVGMVGELYVGGEGVGRGYINNIDLTLAKFVSDPFSNKAGARLYKSGDLARYLADGNIEYLGRIDHQVKIRGFRIELGEIEVAINQYPAVKETVVVVSEESVNSKRLVAYVVPQKEQTLAIPELRSFLESKLPHYMLPSAFVCLEALPLTPNGKVDRKALPVPDTARPELEVVYQPPQTEREKTIADIWQEVLNVENVGIHDNFFELGGHSLLLVQVHSKLQKTFERDFPLVEMFQYPTVSYLATYFNQESSEEISFIHHSRNSESTTASLQRRKQARKEHRTATKEKEVSSQEGNKI
ncbi:MAG: amino acid adenylation domain-containing protein [Nostoc sp.]